MDRKKSRPPPKPRGRAGNGFPGGVSNLSTTTRFDDRRQYNIWFAVDVEIFIGSAYIGFRTTRFIYDLNVFSIVQRPYRSGARKGILRPCRMYGVHRDKRVTVRRYSDPAAAAHAYRNAKQALGFGSNNRLPFNSRGRTFAVMGAAFLTPAGARSPNGQTFAKHLRSHGVYVTDEPLKAQSQDEFWWVDARLEAA
jgi:hypothetical protein